MTTMKRWTFRILVCLMLGVLTTYLAAWSFAIIPPRTMPTGRAYSTFSSPGELALIATWREHTPPDWARTPGFATNLPITAGYTRESYVDAIYNNSRSHERRRELVRLTAGWPWPALEGWSLSYFDADLAARTEERFGLMPLDLSRFIERANTDEVPLRPLWPGFLINTLLAAACWFVLLFGYPTVRETIRAIRRRRGCCPACGYNLQNKFDDGCPECGWGRGAATLPFDGDESRHELDAQ